MCWLGGWCAGGPHPSIPHNHYLSRSSSCPGARPHCFKQLLLFSKLTPLLHPLIFLLGGLGLAGEGSGEDSAPSRQVDLSKTPALPTPPPLIHRGSFSFFTPVAVDNRDRVTEYQCWPCNYMCVSVCAGSRMGMVQKHCARALAA